MNLIIVISSILVLLCVYLYLYERSYNKNKIPFHERMLKKDEEDK